MKTKFKWRKILTLLTFGATITAPIAALTACGHESSSQSATTPSELPKNYTLAQFQTNVANYTTKITSMNDTQLAQELKKLTDGLNSLNTVPGLDEYATMKPFDKSGQGGGWTLKPGKTLDDVYSFFAGQTNTNFFPTAQFFKDHFLKDLPKEYWQRTLSYFPSYYEWFYVVVNSIPNYVKSSIVLRQYFAANNNLFPDLNSPLSEQMASYLLEINFMMNYPYLFDTKDGTSSLPLHWNNNVVEMQNYIIASNTKFSDLYQTISNKYQITNNTFTEQVNKRMHEMYKTGTSISLQTGLAQGIILADPTQTVITLKPTTPPK